MCSARHSIPAAGKRCAASSFGALLFRPGWAPSRIGGGSGHEAMTQVLASEADYRSQTTASQTPVTIRLLGADDWPALRAARLEALEKAPDAFVAEAAVEEKRPASYWINTLKTSTWAAAWAGGEVVGIACLTRKDQKIPAERFIESVWVTPEHRLKGLVWRMLEALEAEARADGTEWLKLWILQTNMAAANAYNRLGFSRVPDSWQGSPKRRPDGEPVREFQMVRQLFPRTSAPAGRASGRRRARSSVPALPARP